MPFPKAIAFKGKYSFILLVFSFLFALPLITFAQIPSETSDLPIDPDALKNASSTELRSYLKDYNQSETQPGDDIHKTLPGHDQVINIDSVRQDEFRSRIADPMSVYGSGIFQNGQIIQLTQLSTPPEDYTIGVGDHIIVTLWGGADFEEDYIVARDGSIFPQGLGKITVQGMPFSKARDIIYQRFRRVIPSSTNISVAMGQPRSIVVQVTGNVQNPGPVVVSAFTNALNVVALAGGVTKYANLRNILISRNGRVIDSIDVYEYLSTGDFGNHTYLENNDFIIVPFYDKKVLATGQFKRPMYYQLKDGEGLTDLLEYTGGFTADAYASGGAIIRNVDEKQIIKTVNFNAIGLQAKGEVIDEPLYNGDIIAVNAINPGLKNKVIVRGEVAYPNVYEVRPGDRLFDVINRAGGVTPNAYLPRAYVFKGAGDSTNLKANKIDVDLTDLNKDLNSVYNIPIDANDVIEVFNVNQFRDLQTVSIEGEVRKPGTYQKYGGMTLKDLIYFANGMKPSAEFGMITVSSVVDIDSAQQGLKPTETTIRTYSVNQNLEMDSITESIMLKPFDQVFVRRNPDFQLQQNVKIAGEVLYQGTYPKLVPDERMSSLIERAGGLQQNSNIAGAILYRSRDSITNKRWPPQMPQVQYLRDSLGNILDSIVPIMMEPVSINLKMALSHPGSKYDMIMKQGDVLYIPSVNPVVAVEGIVQNELRMAYDPAHPNLKYYIDKAGGFGIRPWRRRIYVTYPNGKSSRTKSLLFLHFYPKITEGAVITVPERPETKFFNNLPGQIFTAAIPLAIAYVLTQIK